MANEKITEKEYEKKVIELAKKGLTSEKIGEALKKEGFHSKEFKKKISQILKENNIYESPDLKNITNKLERIKTHYESNKQDKRAKREKDRVFSQLRKTKKYLGLLKEKKK
jgi:ribosomal protein S15P/S13E